MHLQVFVHPQRVHGRGVKSREEHVHDNQQIQFFVLHTK